MHPLDLSVSVSVRERVPRYDSRRIPIIVSLVLFLVVHIKAPSRALNLRYAAKNLDTIGMFMLVTNLTLLIVALNLGGDAYAWNSPTVIGLLVGAGVALLAFVYAESLATYPVLPLGLFMRLQWRNVPLMTGG